MLVCQSLGCEAPYDQFHSPSLQAILPNDLGSRTLYLIFISMTNDIFLVLSRMIMDKSFNDAQFGP